MKKVLVIGMGAIGHTIVTSLDDSYAQIDILTSDKVVTKSISNNQGDSSIITNCLRYEQINSVLEYDYIFLTLPYRHKINRMKQLAPFIDRKTTIVLLPANQGAVHYLPESIQNHNPLILLERVPQISRIDTKYKLVNVFGTRNDLRVASLNDAKIEILQELIPYLDNLQVLKNPLSISLISSNAVLHTSRVYNLFANRNDWYDQEFGFYNEWTKADGKLLIEMEQEVIDLKNKISNCEKIEIELYDLFEYLNITSRTPEFAAKCVREFAPLSKITFYAKDQNELMKNRYVVDDAILGIYYYLKLAEKYDVKMPKMQMVFDWAYQFVEPQITEIEALNV